MTHDTSEPPLRVTERPAGRRHTGVEVVRMRRIQVTKKVSPPREGRYDPLPIDPRDPDILRAKALARRAAGRPRTP